MDKLRRSVLCAVLLATTPIFAQDLPEDEIQVNLNSYFDNFNVKIVYPAISFTKRVKDSSLVNIRYLVDVISAASMRSHFTVDGVTSATEKEDGGGDNRPDEIRHEFGAGYTELMGGGLLKNGQISLNTLYSIEHDYSSFTIAGTYGILAAKKNTALQLGFVRSWDKVFPQIRTWQKRKDVFTFSLNATQIISPKLISQFVLSYNQADGYMADPYQVVELIEDGRRKYLEPSHPNQRIRRAFGIRTNYKTGDRSSLSFGFRYYWDSWEVNSTTTQIQYQQHVGSAFIIGVGLRNYSQGRAYFFKPVYEAPEKYMTVDTKLDEVYSNDYSFKLTINGGRFPGWLLLSNEHVQMNIGLNFYHRHSATADWHSRYKNLYAYLLSWGLRYHF